MRVAIFIENDELDLFDNENIEIVSSITDSSDVTKNTTDYSKGFTVPASDKNNAIFKHYYNATIDNTFDARIKIDGRIELDGLPFKSGKIRLDKVDVKSGSASSYSINFFGKLVNLKDAVKDDELTSLDLSALNFEFTSDNVLDRLQTVLSDEPVICNLLSKRRYYYNSDPTDTTNTETTVNIANVGLRIADIRPSVKLIEIIKAIEDKYDFVFSRDFFGRTEFDMIYMWLNNNATIQGQPTEQLINWTSGLSGVSLGMNLTTDVWTNNTYFLSASTFKIFTYRVKIITTSVDPYNIVVKNNGVVVATIPSSGGTFETDVLEIRTIPDTEFNYTFYVASTSTIDYSAEIDIYETVNTPPIGTPPVITYGFCSASTNSITTVFQISANLPKMKIIDFLKSLFALFKLVIIQENNTDIYVNTLVDYYSQGKLWDMTNYIDFESYEVNRGDILNEIDFSFVEPTTLLNKQFKLNTGLGYGDEQLKLVDENGELLDGKKLEVKPQFEQMVYERLNDVDTGELTNIMYGLAVNENLEPQNPKAHIFYRNIVNVTEKPFKIIKQDLSTVTISGNINTANHTLGFSSIQYALLFSEEFSAWDGSLISKNLYTNYYKDYIDSIFNIKRRNFSFKSIPPLYILLAMRLNDVLKIKDDYYRIDKNTANITNRNVQLNLINSFDNTINPFATDGTIFFSSAKTTSQTIFVKGNDSFTVSLVDSPSWAGYTVSGRMITVEMEANETGLLRGVTVEITNGTKTLTVVIIQETETVRADNNIITADSTLITADNG